MKLSLSFSKIIVFLSFLYLSSFLGGEVLAQEGPVTVAPELVTGSRLAESLDEVPQATYVITAEEIERSRAKTLSEVLDKIPGISTLRKNSWAQDDSLRMRGVATEILILVDGVPYYNASYGADMFNVDLRSIPLESVERVEVIKGAGSALYGSMAAAGVINIITKTPDKYKTSIIAEGGSNDWRRYSVSAGIKGDVFDVGIRYNHREEGEVPIRYYDDEVYKALDYDEDSASIALSWGNWRFGADFGSYNSKWDAGNPMIDKQEDDYKRFYLKYADLKNEVIAYAHFINKEYVQGGQGGDDDLPDFTRPLPNDYDQDIWGLEFTQKSSIGEVPLAWGVAYRFEKLSANGDGLIVDSDKKTYSIDKFSYKGERYNIAPFTQFSFVLGDVLMDIGLRYENWDVDDGKDESEFTPKISFYRQDDSGKLWYLTAGKFFAMPSLYQLYAKDAMLEPNPNLLPEKGYTYDLGVKDPNNRWNVGLFYMTLDNKFKWDQIGSKGRYINLAEFRSLGIEGQFEKALTSNLKWINGMTWQKPEEKQTSSDPWRKGGTPQWELYSELNYDNGPWFGSLSAHYYGQREIDNLQSYHNNRADDDFITVDAILAYDMEDYKITLAAYNIFDEEYIIDTSGYIGPERRVYLTLEHLF
ncbi:TonB-dependent receptor [Acetomicrobium hydrogeniformans]|uniref:TonB-dependent receptor plug domain protein n=1 Tax=Acetomicrobium hydrogeniformans ATCC BAA-1850 TaxID=592015 RepID=A0A0T5XAV5_9BACT|nr:TonB-dependent receptor [Acetomicrobium hydrogeniformans]KRT35513.1 TonB-dependent receptor plug domain protein [Acetomicrobium hydrogeniformans ATCC BAA-1850]